MPTTALDYANSLQLSNLGGGGKTCVNIANLLAIVCLYARNSTTIPLYDVVTANLFFNALICAAK